MVSLWYRFADRIRETAQENWCISKLSNVNEAIAELGFGSSGILFEKV
ncbi:hypothetical protein [Allocoleopsis franciscana]|nr:hypothetical protein [Allocoleopsis franciscana]